MTVEELIKRGLESLRSHNHLAALSWFERAYQMRKDPAIQSYLALCIAFERGKVTDAVSLCRDSINRDPENPVHYLNLGKIYMKVQRKTEALETLRKGLSFGADAVAVHDEIKTLLDKLGNRKAPVFSFLPRGHVLNKYTGLLLRKLRVR